MRRESEWGSGRGEAGIPLSSGTAGIRNTYSAHFAAMVSALTLEVFRIRPRSDGLPQVSRTTFSFGKAFTSLYRLSRGVPQIMSTHPLFDHRPSRTLLAMLVMLSSYSTSKKVRK